MMKKQEFCGYKSLEINPAVENSLSLFELSQAQSEDLELIFQVLAIFVNFAYLH